MLSIAAWVLTFCGTALVLIGAYFLAVRPALLPEDARFMGSSIQQITDAVPALASWLRHVFWVMGGYIATSGLLVVYVARAKVTTGDAGAVAILALAGVSSIGLMSAVNFMIRSDFRWVLLLLSGVWASGIVMAAIAS